MWRAKGILATVALLLIVSVAAAQDQPRGRGRGGFGGGRGGFGGGGFGGMFNSPLGLLGITEVRKELSTSDEQNKEIAEALAMLAPPGGFQGGQDLSDEERQKRRDEMVKKGQEVEQKVNKILKPEQQTRLKQLALQRQGAMAITRPEVAKDLGLTEDQQGKIRDIQESANRPQGGGANFQDLSDEERQKLFTEMRQRREKTQTEMLAVLTDDQKAKFTEMKGKEFKFPEFGGFGGGAGGGGPRRRPETKQREE